MIPAGAGPRAALRGRSGVGDATPAARPEATPDGGPSSVRRDVRMINDVPGAYSLWVSSSAVIASFDVAAGV